MKNEISLSKFLVRYYKVHDENILNMTHDDVKNLFPQIKRASFDYAKKCNDSVANGEIIMVRDCRGKIIPYVCPQIIVKSEMTIDIEISYFQCDKKKKEKIEKLSKEELRPLTNWELIQLLKKYRKNLISCYEVYREMEKRGINAPKREEKRRKKVIYEEY